MINQHGTVTVSEKTNEKKQPQESSQGNGQNSTGIGGGVGHALNAEGNGSVAPMRQSRDSIRELFQKAACGGSLSAQGFAQSAPAALTQV